MRNMMMVTALAGTLAAGVMGATQLSPAPRQIQLMAKKFEFTPAQVEVKVGEPIELTVSSQDAKHGFECKDLGIKKVTFEEGKPAHITFTATKPGTFAFKCANYCGRGHGGMKGQIVVSQ
jgi:cytochrome c oxidase subunit 2